VREEQVVAALRAAGCVFAEDEAAMLIGTARDEDELAAMVRERATGVPIEHVVGWADFCGVRVAVDPGVFVPRVRTQVLAEQAAAATRPGATVVDLCCGSGAIGLVVAMRVSDVRLYASDVEPAAVTCARRNLAPLKDATVVQGDLFEALPRDLLGTVDVLLSNVPYVPSPAIEYLPAEAREYEPRTALDGGADGLDVLRRVAAEAPRWLAPHGRLFVESSLDQAEIALAIMASVGLRPELFVDDEVEVAVVTGHRPPSTAAVDPA
jgi:release factor glutamine methyltransferase